MHSLMKNSLRNLNCFQTLVVRFSSSLTQNQVVVADHHLINTVVVGLTRQEAVSAAKHFPSKVTSVTHFLKKNGFSETQIKCLISRQPRFLSLHLDKTLKPKFEALGKVGFSGSDLALLFQNDPNIIKSTTKKTLLPNIEFLRSLLKSDENIVRVVRKCSWILSKNLPKVIGRKVDILHRYKVPDHQISKFLLKRPRFFIQKPGWLEGLVDQVEKFGVKKGSGLFLHAIDALGALSNDTLDAKLEMFKSFGWSDSDFVSAFRKSPGFLTYSEQKVRASMGFYMEEVGLKPRDIAVKPVLLSYSLEKRLKPRFEVIKILKAKGLIKSNLGCTSIVFMSAQKFLEDFVLEYVEEAPELQEAYNILRASKQVSIPSSP